MTRPRSNFRRIRANRAAIAAGILLLLSAAARAHAQDSPRSKDLSLKLMCVCGCNQILGQCNHIGCSYSHEMLRELDERVARSEPDDLTLQAFVQEYGPTVLAEPPAKGFNRAAWLMPVVVPMFSLYLVWEVVRRWRRRGAIAAASARKVSPELLARAQRESGAEAPGDSHE